MKGVAIRPFYAFFMKLGITALLLAGTMINNSQVLSQVQYTRYWNQPTQEYSQEYNSGDYTITLRAREMEQVNTPNLQIHQKLIWYRYADHLHAEVTEKVINIYTYKQVNNNYPNLNISHTEIDNIIPTINNYIYSEVYSYAYLGGSTTGTTLNNFLLNTTTYNYNTLYNIVNIATNDSYYDDTAQITQTPQANIFKSNKNKQYVLVDEVNNYLNYGDEQLPYNPNQQNLINFYSRSDITVDYTTDVNITDYEVIDIPNIMFTILGMPFAWISTAFNLTIFPGTPYAINLSHIFFAIIGSLIIIFVIKKVIK